MSAPEPWGRDEPWMTHLARRFLEAILEPTWSVFEWGAGASTLYFARRVTRIATVEHDPQWGARVRSALADAGLDQRVEFYAVPFSARYNLQLYPEAISRDSHAYDLILVDGRRRVACATAAQRQLKPGGWLVLDNSERAEYAPIWAMFEGWERASFDGPGRHSHKGARWQTMFWRQPNA